MGTDPGAVRERARTARIEPPVYGLEEPRWTAEDPDTGCLGVGIVEAEAVGNLVAAVVRREADDAATPYVKLPGRVVERSWHDDAGGGALDRLADLLGRRS